MADPSQIEDLLTAVRNGEKLTVSELLDSDALDAYIEQNGGKLLLEFPSCEIAELLILKGANVDAVCEDGKTLLNKAASRGDVEIMHLLMFYGATKWNCCVDGRKFFKRLFANSLLSSQLLDDELAAVKRVIEAKYKYKTLRLFIEEKKFLLESLLQDPAPLRRKESVIGANITWRITEGVDSARDYVSGQNIAWDLVLFRVPVYVVCPGVEVQVRHNKYVEVSDWLIPVFGTNRQVLKSIYAAYQPFPDLDIIFGGLKKLEKGKYLLQINN